MSKITDLDILRFLDGNSGPDETRSLKSWMKENKTHKKDVRNLRVISEHAPLLESFNLVDEEAEWQQFLKNTTPELTELQILHHLDGFSTYSDKKKVASWTAKSEENKSDMEVYEMIIREAPHLADYKMTSAQSEWTLFQPKLMKKEAVVKPLQPSVSKAAINQEKSGFVFPMWQKLAAAAAIALLIVSVWVMRPQETYTELIASANGETVEMVDGSVIELAPNSKLRYPKKLKNLDERRLYLTGRGKFSVARNDVKPFVVEVNERIGIEVLGTVFKLDDHDTFVEVVENIEGKVRVYQLSNHTVNVILEKGDKYGFDGSKFIDLNVEPEIVDNAVDHEILYVLDYLMEQSGWKVISSPYTDFVENGIVTIDLDQPYEDVLKDLAERADFEYEKLTCEGCYIIRKFKPLPY